MARGYVYILFNQSMPGHLKIGKTAGSPEERAKDLSQNTSTPLPFVVAWQAELFYFDQAEREIHERLKSFRLRSEREFFMIPLREAIKVAGEVADLYSKLEQADQDAAEEIKKKREQAERDATEETKRKAGQGMATPEVAPTVRPSPPAVLIAGPKLLVVRGLKCNVEYVIEPGRNYIGRACGRLASIDLENQEPPQGALCSQQQAFITFEVGRLTIEDLKSTNGTYVNRHRILAGESQALAVGDIIQIGTIHLKVAVSKCVELAPAQMAAH